MFGQFKKIERRHCPTRTAEKNQITARTQNIQVARESVLAHAVVNNVHPLIAGQPFRFGLKILFGIDDYFISTRAARELLEQQGFKIGKIRYAYDGDRSGGLVLNQSPSVGAPAPAGAVVDLTVNED